MKGIQIMFVKDNSVGLKTRFGPNWPGKRCGAKTRAGNHCRRPAYKHNGRCSLHGGLSTGPKTQSEEIGFPKKSEAWQIHKIQTYRKRSGSYAKQKNQI